MRFEKLFRAMWLRNSVERSWFATQYALYYVSCRKSVALYALRRLSLIYKMPLTIMDGNQRLVAIYADSELSFGRRSCLSFLLPMELRRNPLRLIVDDYSCAEDYRRGLNRDWKDCAVDAMSLREDSTVADYVRFIVEYDKALMRTDHLRVTTFLGVSPP